VNAVAILCRDSRPLVGALGIYIGWRQSQGEREHSLALARAQQDHTLALADHQYEHDRRLRSGDRLFEKRGDLYVRLLLFLDRQLLRVERTNPIMTVGGPQEPPEPEDEAETAQLQSEVGVYGSAEAWRLLQELSDSVHDFFVQSWSLDTARSGRTEETATHWEAVQKARERVRELTAKTREQVQREIETL
jgi:hypothetical protein